MEGEALSRLEEREALSVRVRMMVLGHVVEVDREARSIEELETILKI